MEHYVGGGIASVSTATWVTSPNIDSELSLETNLTAREELSSPTCSYVWYKQNGTYESYVPVTVGEWCDMLVNWASSVISITKLRACNAWWKYTCEHTDICAKILNITMEALQQQPNIKLMPTPNSNALAMQKLIQWLLTMTAQNTSVLNSLWRSIRDNDIYEDCFNLAILHEVCRYYIKITGSVGPWRGRSIRTLDDEDSLEYLSDYQDNVPSTVTLDVGTSPDDAAADYCESTWSLCSSLPMSTDCCTVAVSQHASDIAGCMGNTFFGWWRKNKEILRLKKYRQLLMLHKVAMFAVKEYCVDLQATVNKHKLILQSVVCSKRKDCLSLFIYGDGGSAGTDNCTAVSIILAAYNQYLTHNNTLSRLNQWPDKLYDFHNMVSLEDSIIQEHLETCTFFDFNRTVKDDIKHYLTHTKLHETVSRLLEIKNAVSGNYLMAQLSTDDTTISDPLYTTKYNKTKSNHPNKSNSNCKDTTNQTALQHHLFTTLKNAFIGVKQLQVFETLCQWWLEERSQPPDDK